MTHPTPQFSCPRVVIVGNGMVGHRLVENLRVVGPDALSITVVSEETRLAYDRVRLSACVDDDAPDLALATPNSYQAQGVKVAWGRAIAVDRAAKTVTVAGKTETQNPRL